jgi:FKBP-type peptidyl-prolyl cis-trans isomerase (trigger factor)
LPPVSGVLRTAALALLAFVGVALVACGGSDEREAKNAYVRQVNAAQAEFAQTVTTVSERITEKSSSRQDRRTLEQFQTAIDDVVTDLRDIDVPDTVDAEHAQLVKAMDGFGGDIRGAIGALSNPTQANIEEARKTITTAAQTVNVRIQAAIAAINSKLSQS